MTQTSLGFEQVCRSLSDLTLTAQVEQACQSRAMLSGEDLSELLIRADEPVDFYPEAFQKRQLDLLSKVGTVVIDPVPEGQTNGASSKSFNAATKIKMSPLSGAGLFRIGESGRLYLITKSEHYHAPLGHSFPGYALIERARG
ncbi:MAG: hypothetical protein KC931_18270, partial [Candidatus Omnitrophica bacterium]|nr:hypothetical protein [Candidatus Omnitrophota bacterium]